MTASASATHKFVLGAKPPKKLSPEAKQLLETSPPGTKAIERAAKIVKFKVVDGSAYGI